MLDAVCSRMAATRPADLLETLTTALGATQLERGGRTAQQQNAAFALAASEYAASAAASEIADVPTSPDEAAIMLGASLSSALALAPALSRAEAAVRAALREVGSWAAVPCASDEHAEAQLRMIIWAQRELLAWAAPARRAAVCAWLDGPIRARAEQLRWQLRKYMWPQCAACTQGACGTHGAQLEARLPPLPAQMRDIGVDAVGNLLAFWHARSHAALDLAGCLEAAAILTAAEDWALPLRDPARAAAAARLAAGAAPTAEALACQLHNRLFPACSTPWARCAEHRARWQLPPPAPIPPLPFTQRGDAEAAAQARPLPLGRCGQASESGGGGRGPAIAHGGRGRQGAFVPAQRSGGRPDVELSPLPPMHGVVGD